MIQITTFEQAEKLYKNIQEYCETGILPSDSQIRKWKNEFTFEFSFSYFIGSIERRLLDFYRDIVISQKASYAAQVPLKERK